MSVQSKITEALDEVRMASTGLCAAAKAPTGAEVDLFIVAARSHLADAQTLVQAALKELHEHKNQNTP